MKPTDFAIHLSGFLGNYLPAQRNVSPNTIKAYRDAFTLLLRYFRDQREILPEKVTLNLIDASLILAFLDYLETKQGCGTRTRNHRLSVLHAFFRYLQAEEPDKMVQCQQILAIPHHRCARPTVEYLSTDEIAAILVQPDLSTLWGRRDAVLLSVLYDTGARVQEIANLSVRDVRLDSPAQIQLTGKGRKSRVVPLLSGTVDLLDAYLREHQFQRIEQKEAPLFFNRRGERLTRFGIRYILAKHTEKARKETSGLPERISPHTTRHSKAMHLLQAGNPASVIQAILGHTDIRSTDIYARADLKMKREALEKATATVPSINTKPSWKDNKGVMDWLRSL